MKNGEIFKKTMPFVWGRFGMQLLLNVGMIIYFAILVGLFIMLIESQAIIAVIIGLIGLPIGLKIYSFGCEYIGYMIKAAHVAVIGELSLYGKVPDGVKITEYGKNKVKERFLTANAFFAIDKLMSSAVKQIQNMITKVGNVFEKVEIIQTIIKIVNIFVGIVLGYVDEAVLARVFQKKEDGAWKASADGVVLYFQNWKEILKNALLITVGIIAFYAIGIGLIYAVAAGLSLVSDLWVILLIFAAYFLIDVIKVSFIDSYVTIAVVNKYLPLTINQTPAIDIYEKAQGWSKKFKEMCDKAKTEPQPVVQAAVAGVPGMAMAMPNNSVATQQPQVIMGQPGAVQPMMPQQPVIINQTPTTQVVTPNQMAPQQQVAQPQVVPQPVVQPQVLPQPTPHPTQPVQPIVQPQPVQQPVVAPVASPQVQPQTQVQQLPNNNGQM